MITLKTEFISGDGGFSSDPLTYKQVKRTQSIALYERSRNGKTMDYEVFIIKIDKKGKQIFDKTLEDDREKYPSNNCFGFSAWSFGNLQSAEKRFDALVKSENAEPEEKKEIVIPNEEFTTTELADKNKVNYITASNFIKNAKNIKFVREERRNLKGKMSKIYKKL